jgi:hypothetical protein
VKPDPPKQKTSLNRDSDSADEPDDTNSEETAIQASERRHLQRAINIANEATRLEEQLEASLTPDRLNPSYGRHVQRSAKLYGAVPYKNTSSISA